MDCTTLPGVAPVLYTHHVKTAYDAARVHSTYVSGRVTETDDGWDVEAPLVEQDRAPQMALFIRDQALFDRLRVWAYAHPALTEHAAISRARELAPLVTPWLSSIEVRHTAVNVTRWISWRMDRLAFTREMGRRGGQASGAARRRRVELRDAGIRRSREEGASLRALAQAYSLSVSGVRHVLHRCAVNLSLEGRFWKEGEETKTTLEQSWPNHLTMRPGYGIMRMSKVVDAPPRGREGGPEMAAATKAKAKPKGKEEEPKKERPLAKKAMLVTLMVGSWSPNVHDAAVTNEVARNYSAAQNAGWYTKRLFQKNVLHGIGSIGSTARAIHYRLTMPWDDKGTRLLPTAFYNEYRTKVDALIDQRQDAVNAFLRNYKQHIDEAKKSLGSLFNQKDYPSEQYLRDRLVMSYHKEPVPDASHFVADLAADEAEGIRKSMDSMIAAQTRKAVGSVYEMVEARARIVADYLHVDEDGKQGVFRKELLAWMHDFATLLPDLNVTDDPELAALARKAARAVEGIEDPRQVRYHAAEFDPEKHQQLKVGAEEMQEAAEKLLGLTPDPAQEGE